MYISRKIALTLLFGWALIVTESSFAAGETVQTQWNQVRIHVVFNNLPYRAGLQTGWGFACLIEGPDKTVLFDTGGNGDILISNMQQLGLDANAVEAVVLSHIHGDHTGGLDGFMAHNPDVTVYVPESFPASFQREVRRLGAAVETVDEPRQLLAGIHTTGEMNHGIAEQALIVDTQNGLVVITGCAHPNVADMTERAQSYLGRNVYLLMGGFHLDSSTDTEVKAIIDQLKALGVRKVSPSHCTGERAINLFREAWKSDFVDGGLGAVISVP
ncbi:metal-dependent hydrolase [Thiohalobacter sp. COW1]|uniref:Metal-dependent hydrolases n=1 Tax=Thiohalobacter thiocyanaticus TaxID=585455 RepID=A0A1Z4VR21_9GAMM|nr:MULTISPECIES: MBL fold metallo-hydrolase [Thiohalobacter]BAZ93654.1 metal-dependent hydrolases [Thiohalobacter thiocyanaticus]BCO31260.1 metal-dependent hydrolase [Thiohalobacter sp. COW1]